MKKPAALRAALSAALPELSANPDKLTLTIEQGRMVAARHTLSHNISYTLSVLLIDFGADFDILTTTIIHWLQSNEPDALTPGDTDPGAITIDADILDNDKLDILIRIKLTERTRAILNDRQEIVIDHPSPVQHDPHLTYGTATS